VLSESPQDGLPAAVQRRSEALPEIPAIAEFLPGYEAIAVGRLGAPRETPVDIIDKLKREVNTDPTLIATFAEFGATPLLGSASEFGKLIVAETEKWAKVAKFANIKPE
jgi:tripartite-type tricarboxylate transporter receptor subunit TctC